MLSLLERRGAQFFAELERASGLLAAALEDALWELAAGGRVTADGFDNLRALMDPRRRSAFGRYRRRKARYSAGRWALLAASAPDGDGTPAAGQPDRDEFLARQLLDRWGVVFRDLLKRERREGQWRRMQPVLRRLEMRGEVVGGQFVTTFSGEQFALPEAVEKLRRIRREGGANGGARPSLDIGAADPLNLSGILLPGPRIAVSSNETLALENGALSRVGRRPIRPDRNSPGNPPSNPQTSSPTNPEADPGGSPDEDADAA